MGLWWVLPVACFVFPGPPCRSRLGRLWPFSMINVWLNECGTKPIQSVGDIRSLGQSWCAYSGRNSNLDVGLSDDSVQSCILSVSNNLDKLSVVQGEIKSSVFQSAEMSRKYDEYWGKYMSMTHCMSVENKHIMFCPQNDHAEAMPGVYLWLM